MANYLDLFIIYCIIRRGDTMLDDLVLKEITGVFHIYSKAGVTEHNKNRADYGLSFCNEGKITYRQNGVKYISDKSVAVILPKHSEYDIFRQETGFFPVINFQCENFSADHFLLFPVENPKKLVIMFEDLCRHIQYGEKLKAKSVFYEILAEIDAGNRSSTFSCGEKFIYENLGDPALNNKKIADHLKISEAYLNKKFREKHGMPPKKFVEKARIENAVKLLAENECTIGEIAEICGYSGIYSFSRAFKNRMGISPMNYKRKMNSGR